jgi:hypothetical protein
MKLSNQYLLKQPRPLIIVLTANVVELHIQQELQEYRIRTSNERTFSSICLFILRMFQEKQSKRYAMLHVKKQITSAKVSPE